VKKILLNIREVVIATGLSRATICKFVKSGALPVVKVGARTLIREADLLEFIDKRITSRSVAGGDE
jgi:excisionase family DNA binding protein